MAHPATLDRLLGPLLTLNEWRDLPEDVPGELVDGRLVEEEMPDPLHEVIVAWLARMLGNWVPDAIVLSSEMMVAFVSGLIARSSVNLTESALKSSPLWNLTPLRRTNS